MDSKQLEQHDARHAWWLRLHNEAAKLGVDQITDEELIAANLAFYKGMRASTVARFISKERGK
jgi:hypothetical protein